MRLLSESTTLQSCLPVQAAWNKAHPSWYRTCWFGQVRFRRAVRYDPVEDLCTLCSGVGCGIWSAVPAPWVRCLHCPQQNEMEGS